MLVVEWIAVGVVAILLAIFVLFLRRAAFARAGGTIRLGLRVTTFMDGRGWSPGFGRFVGGELRWYRMFSFAFRPKRVLRRNDLNVESRRLPDGQERLSMPADWVILRCTHLRAPVEIAMARSTVTGFSSWLESSPPGTDSRRLAIPEWPAV